MAAKDRSSATSGDQQLVETFEPAVLEMLPGPGEQVHAETLLTLCLADGVLEVLEWAREGTGADPAATMWLASLRWHRLITGGFPESAPQPQPRPTDHALKLILDSGSLEVLPGSAEESLAGLASGEMGTRGAPAQPEADGDAALARITPLGLVPYVETEMKQDWAEQAICLTHGHPRLVAAARRLAADLHNAYQHSAHQHSDAAAPQVCGAQSSHTMVTSESTGAAGVRHELLTVVVEDLGRRWRAVARPDPASPGSRPQ